MNINLGSLLFAILSIMFAKVVTEFSIPYLDGLFDLSKKQEKWIFLLMVWLTGYYGYALKNWLIDQINKEKLKEKEEIN